MYRNMSTRDVQEMNKDYGKDKEHCRRGEDRRIGINSVVSPSEDRRIILDRRGLGKFLIDRRKKGILV